MSSQKEETPEVALEAKTASEEVTPTSVASAVAALESGIKAIATSPDSVDGNPSKKHPNTPQQSPIKKTPGTPKKTKNASVSSVASEPAATKADEPVMVEPVEKENPATTESAALTSESKEVKAQEELKETAEPKPQRERGSRSFPSYGPRGGMVSPPFKRNFNLEESSNVANDVDGKPITEQKRPESYRYRPGYFTRGGLVSPPYKRNFNLEEASTAANGNNGKAQSEQKRAEPDRDRPGYFRARTIRRDSEKVERKDPAIIESKKANDVAVVANVPTSSRKPRNRRGKGRSRSITITIES